MARQTCGEGGRQRQTADAEADRPAMRKEGYSLARAAVRERKGTGFMALTENVGWAAGEQAEADTAAQMAGGREAMVSKPHCAYNQTRECFLGLEVSTADLTSDGLDELLSARPLKSGEGVWLTPFRGIPASSIPAPLDLIYLDDDCRVIETVESFPTFQVSSSIPRPGSVLALPAHSIYSSQTQAGDQLVLCVAEEMEQRLERLAKSQSEPSAESTIVGAALLREKPLWSDGPGVLELENRVVTARHSGHEAHQMDLTPPATKKSAKPAKSWFERWWSPDPRRAPRSSATGLAAYYWNGAAPTAHGIRDISLSGMYVVTEERWYPGTLVLMMIQRNERGEEIVERAVSVHSRAVRWGADGVGLQFVLPDEKEVREGRLPLLDANTRKELNRFLECLKK